MLVGDPTASARLNSSAVAFDDSLAATLTLPQRLRSHRVRFIRFFESGNEESRKGISEIEGQGAMGSAEQGGEPSEFQMGRVRSCFPY